MTRGKKRKGGRGGRLSLESIGGGEKRGGSFPRIQCLYLFESAEGEGGEMGGVEKPKHHMSRRHGGGSRLMFPEKKGAKKQIAQVGPSCAWG